MDGPLPDVWFQGSLLASPTEADLDSLRLVRPPEPGTTPDETLARRYGRDTLYEGDAA